MKRHRKAALFPMLDPAEIEDDETNNNGAEADNLSPAVQDQSKPKLRGKKTTTSSASKSSKPDVQKKPRGSRKQSVALKESDDDPLPVPDVEIPSKTSKKNTKPGKRTQTGSKSDSKVPEKKKYPNKKSSSSMRVGWKMPPSHTKLEAQYCGRYVFKKTGGDQNIVIRSLDEDEPEIQFVLAGAAGFPRIKKNLLRFINKNRRQGWKLNSIDYSDLPEELPPYVAQEPPVMDEQRLQVLMDEQKNPDDNDDTHPDPPSSSSKSSSKPKSRAKKSSVKPSSESKNASSIKSKGTKRSAALVHEIEEAYLMDANKDPDDDRIHHNDDDSNINYPDPPASSSKSSSQPKEASTNSKRTKTAAFLIDETEEGYLLLAQENLDLREENENLSMENRALTRMLLKTSRVDIHKMNLRSRTLNPHPEMFSDCSVHDSPRLNIDNLIDGLEDSGDSDFSMLNNNNNPMIEKTNKVYNDSFLDEVDVMDLLMDSAEESTDPDPDQHIHHKRVPRVKLVKSRAEEEFSDGDGPSDSDHLDFPDVDGSFGDRDPDSLDGNNNNRYSSLPVAPQFLFHWVTRDETSDLRLKALYEPFQGKLQDMLDLMLPDPDPSSIVAEIINEVLHTCLQNSSATLANHTTFESIVSSGSEKPLVIDESAVSDNSFSPHLSRLPEIVNRVVKKVAATTREPPKAILLPDENVQMLEILHQSMRPKGTKSTKKSINQKTVQSSLPRKSTQSGSSFKRYYAPRSGGRKTSYRKEQEMLGKVRREQSSKKLKEEEEEKKLKPELDKLNAMFKRQTGDLSKKIPKIQKKKPAEELLAPSGSHSKEGKGKQGGKL